MKLIALFAAGMLAGWAGGHLAQPHWRMEVHPSGAIVLLEERSGRLEWYYGGKLEIERPGQRSWWRDWLSR